MHAGGAAGNRRAPEEVVGQAAGDLLGEPIEGAIALARSAQHGEVLLSDATHAIASHAIEGERALDRRRPAAASGPWRRWRRSRRRLESPMIGRHAEMTAARLAYARAVEGGDAHLLTVIGDAGIGKSRLALELSEQLPRRGHGARPARYLSYGQGLAFWPLRGRVRPARGEQNAPRRDSRAARRRSRAGRSGRRYHRRLRHSASRGTHDAADPAPDNIGEQAPWAFCVLLEQLAADRPVMLVIEDAHWAEPALLDLVDHLVDWLRVLRAGAVPEPPGAAGGQAQMGRRAGTRQLARARATR